MFEVRGVCDPSPAALAFMAAEFGLPTFPTIEALLDVPLDTVVIASPDALHHEQALMALQRGLHVYCEKPLCYAPVDIDELIAARRRAGKVLQVGYMKRFDPSCEAALTFMPVTAKTLRYVFVEVNDPDAWPFIRHHNWSRADDVAPELKSALLRKQQDQVARALQKPVVDLTYRGFVGSYCSSLVHDVNTVHGLLEELHSIGRETGDGANCGSCRPEIADVIRECRTYVEAAE